MSHLNRVEAYAKGRSNFSLADAAIATQGSETGTAARLRDLRQLGYTVTVVKVKGTKVRLYSVSNVRLANTTSAVKGEKPTAKDTSYETLSKIAEAALRKENSSLVGGRITVVKALSAYING